MATWFEAIFYMLDYKATRERVIGQVSGRLVLEFAVQPKQPIL